MEKEILKMNQITKIYGNGADQSGLLDLKGLCCYDGTKSSKGERTWLN